MKKPQPAIGFCPYYHRAIELIGRRWTGVILQALLNGQTRFSVIGDSVPGLSDRLLSERLKELESEGIVTRTVYPETPVRIEYRLTEKGRALGEATQAISRWAHDWHTPACDGAHEDDRPDIEPASFAASGSTAP